MLTSGMVPALFPDDEKEAIIGQVPMQHACACHVAIYLYLCVYIIIYTCIYTHVAKVHYSYMYIMYYF